MRKVVIDGLLYVPAKEAEVSTREAVARVLADQFWGGLDKTDWETDFDKKMCDVWFEPNEVGEGISAHDFLDSVVRYMRPDDAG